MFIQDLLKEVIKEMAQLVTYIIHTGRELTK